MIVKTALEDFMGATLLVLAAGMGSRYGGIKQIEPVGRHGEGIIDYSVFDAIRAGFDRVVFVIRRDIEEDFKAFVGSRFKGKVAVDYVYQELSAVPAGFAVPERRTKPWGTGHAILLSRDAVNEPFAAINADDFYGSDAYRVLFGHLDQVDPTSSRYAMVGYRLDKTLSDNGTVARAICRVGADGNLRDMAEHTKIERIGRRIVSHLAEGSDRDLQGNETVSMNIFGFTPAVFPQLEKLFTEFLESSGSEEKSEFYIPAAASSLIERGEASLRVLQSGADWFGMTYKEDRESVIRNVRELVESGQYPDPLWG